MSAGIFCTDVEKGEGKGLVPLRDLHEDAEQTRFPSITESREIRNNNLQNDPFFDITRETIRSWKKLMITLAVQCSLALQIHLAWCTFLQGGLNWWQFVRWLF